jgi:signal peptidase I
LWIAILRPTMDAPPLFYMISLELKEKTAATEDAAEAIGAEAIGAEAIGATGTERIGTVRVKTIGAEAIDAKAIGAEIISAEAIATKTANTEATGTAAIDATGTERIGTMRAKRIDAEAISAAAWPAIQPEAASLDSAGGLSPDKRVRRFWSWSRRRMLVLTAIVLGIRIFVGEASVVPTASMEGTILVGDHLFMDKMLYGPEIPVVNWRLPILKTVRRGEIVVFRYPRNPAETFLKRVAAVGGDQLEIRNGVLYVNSAPVQEPYAVHHAAVHNPLESWGPTVVPQGKLFVMGDNRDNSSDSRDWGFVPVQNVIGEPLFVYWSYDAPSSRWLDENLAHRMSFYASIAENFFSRTRWSRTGMLL